MDNYWPIKPQRVVIREKWRETRYKVPAIFMQQGCRDSNPKCVLREQGSLPGGCICLRALYLDYTFIWDGLVSSWQFTEVRIELKFLLTTPAFRCGERGFFPGQADNRGSQKDGGKEESLES